MLRSSPKQVFHTQKLHGILMVGDQVCHLAEFLSSVILLLWKVVFVHVVCCNLDILIEAYFSGLDFSWDTENSVCPSSSAQKSVELPCHATCGPAAVQTDWLTGTLGETEKYLGLLGPTRPELDFQEPTPGSGQIASARTSWYT